MPLQKEILLQGEEWIGFNIRIKVVAKLSVDYIVFTIFNEKIHWKDTDPLRLANGTVLEFSRPERVTVVPSLVRADAFADVWSLPIGRSVVHEKQVL